MFLIENRGNTSSCGVSKCFCNSINETKFDRSGFYKEIVIENGNLVRLDFSGKGVVAKGGSVLVINKVIFS